MSTMWAWPHTATIKLIPRRRGYSRAFSKDAVLKNLGGALDEITKLSPDLLLLQEVDIDSTRSYHVDQRELVYAALPDYASIFAQNYDSPYLLYPFSSPHGKSVAGLMTLSAFQMDSALRRSLCGNRLYEAFDLEPLLQRCAHPRQKTAKPSAFIISICSLQLRPAALR